MSNCLVCGYANVLGTLFCEGCGYDLTCTAHGRRQQADSMAPTPPLPAPPAVMRPGRLTPADTAAGASLFAPAVPDESEQGCSRRGVSGCIPVRTCRARRERR